MTIEDLIKNIPQAAIKSIQSGLVTTPAVGTTTSTVTISTVVPEKCSVSFEGVARHSDGFISLPYKTDLTSTTLTIGYSGASAPAGQGTYSWQIIEFY